MISPVQTTSQLSTIAEPRGTASPTGAANAVSQPAKIASSTSTAANSSDADSSTAPVGRANPSFRFDPAAGVVVIQFRDDSGEVNLSIPSQKQLDAYTTGRDEGQQPGSNTLLA